MNEVYREFRADSAVLITMQENIQGIPPLCVTDTVLRRRPCNAGASYQMKDVSEIREIRMSSRCLLKFHNVVPIVSI